MATTTNNNRPIPKPRTIGLMKERPTPLPRTLGLSSYGFSSKAAPNNEPIKQKEKKVACDENMVTIQGKYATRRIPASEAMNLNLLPSTSEVPPFIPPAHILRLVKRYQNRTNRPPSKALQNRAKAPSQAPQNFYSYQSTQSHPCQSSQRQAPPASQHLPSSFGHQSSFNTPKVLPPKEESFYRATGNPEMCDLPRTSTEPEVRRNTSHHNYAYSSQDDWRDF